jgi:hypothetical protein
MSDTGISKQSVWIGRVLSGFAVLFPVYIGVLIWLGLYLRDSRLRQML